MIGVIRITVRNVKRTRMLVWLVAGALLSGTVVRACSWSYIIWGIRSKPADPLFRFLKSGKAGYINSSGKIVIQPTLPASGNSGGEFHEGLMAVSEQPGFQYLDRSGKPMFRTDAWLAFDFSEGFAPAARYAGFPADASPKWGFIDRTGSFAVPPQYFWVDPFSEGLARVSVDSEVGSTGYIDNHGQFVIPPHLSYGASFHEDRAAVIISGPCRITNGGSCSRAEFKPTMLQATYDCRWAFIDKSGQPVSDLRFDDAQDFSEWLAPVRIGRELGYVNRSGRISIPTRFQSAQPFSEGFAAVGQDGKIGFINHSGNFVIAPRFESAESFSDGRALISQSGNSSFIDKTGNAAFSGTYSTATSFTYGLANVALNREGRLAWINTSGKPVFSYAAK